jgi:hypothetical protein
MKKIITPESEIIEQTALTLAASFYEVGRSSGLQSKHKNARSYAKANMELFIPRALEHLLEMLGNPSFPQDGKDLIYRAIMERSNDDDMRTLFPSDTQNDIHLNNFQLPKDFMEQYFPAKKVS